MVTMRASYRLKSGVSVGNPRQSNVDDESVQEFASMNDALMACA